MPAFCTSCGRLVLADVLAKRPRCGACKHAVTIFTDASLHSRPEAGSPPIFSWNTHAGEFVLPNAAYRCPDCHELKMRFFEAGCWD